jgi:hypothetical protein
MLNVSRRDRKRETRGVRMKARFIVVAMVVGASAVGAGAQIPLAGAPFTATWTVTTKTDGNVVIRTAVAARTTDGSVYQTMYQDGIQNAISINDVPHAKMIHLQLQSRAYSARTAPAWKWEGRAIEQWRDDMERRSVGYTSNGANGYKTVATSLGVKTEGGFTLYGTHYVRSRDKKVFEEEDIWETDLGFTYFERKVDPEQKRVETRELTGLKLGEPDAALFAIPKGFVKTEYQQLQSGLTALNNTCSGAPAVPGVPDGQPGPCPLPPPSPVIRGPGVRTWTAGSADSWSQTGQPTLGSPLPGPH